MLLFGANRALIFTIVRGSATECVNYSNKGPDWGVVSLLLFAHVDPRRALTREVAIADEERGCHQFLVVLELVL